MLIEPSEQHPNLFSTKPHPHRTSHIIIGVAVAFVTLSLLVIGYTYRNQFLGSESPPDPMSEKEQQLVESYVSNSSRTLTSAEISTKESQINSVNRSVTLTPDQVARKKAQLSQQ